MFLTAVLPSSENPILSLTMTLDAKLDADGIQRLAEQLSHFTGNGRKEDELSR